MKRLSSFTLVAMIAFLCTKTLAFHAFSKLKYFSRNQKRLQIAKEDIDYSQRKSLKRFVQVELWRKPELESIYPVLCSIEGACRDINRLMRRVATDNLDGLHRAAEPGSKFSVNIHGESQKKLDMLANNILKISLCCTGRVSMVASEEDSKACLCSEVTHNTAFSGDYVVVYDPLDGSSNIDSGLPTGTIFGIYRKPTFGPSDPTSTMMQKGLELVAAGYCLYSASTHLVMTLRNGLHMFTLDEITGEFYLTKSNIRIPDYGNIYSFNDAYTSSWPNSVQQFVQDLKTNTLRGSPHPRKPTARYMGALVADVHNILLNGGIYGYPSTITHPEGKLRLLYEANPMAIVLEEAGGMASNGLERILDVPIKGIHSRTPLFLGSRHEVRALEEYISANHIFQ